MLLIRGGDGTMDEQANEAALEPRESEHDSEEVEWGLDESDLQAGDAESPPSEADLAPSEPWLEPIEEDAQPSGVDWEPEEAALQAGDAVREPVAEEPVFGGIDEEPREEEPLPREAVWIPSQEEMPASDAIAAPDSQELQPTSEELYQAFVPRRMGRDRVAKMNYASAIQMISRARRRGDPRELEGLTLTDEEIAAAIQDYARGIDGEVDRQNWLLAQILDEQRRQSRSLRAMNTVLILLIAFLLLAIISSCVLVFVQFPNLIP
jgi:hypothetical protein